MRYVGARRVTSPPAKELAMRVPHASLVAGAWLALTPSCGLADSSMRCPGGIVSIGDTKLDLVAKCGEPALREEVQENRSATVQQSVPGVLNARVVTAAIERWTYDFGPQQFMMSATLEMGKVVDIERGGYGYSKEQLRRASQWEPAARCDSPPVHPGDLKLDVLAKCGEPDFRSAAREERVVSTLDPRTGERISSSAMVEVETWTYDLGPNRFVQTVHFENGAVTRIERGDHGY
jgi:hypothetical protein